MEKEQGDFWKFSYIQNDIENMPFDYGAFSVPTQKAEMSEKCMQQRHLVSRMLKHWQQLTKVNAN